MEHELNITVDEAAVKLILQGLALLPYGQVNALYEALVAAAVEVWPELIEEPNE